VTKELHFILSEIRIPKPLASDYRFLEANLDIAELDEISDTMTYGKEKGGVQPVDPSMAENEKTPPV